MSLRERYRDWMTPDTVEKASRNERVKRDVWMILSFWTSAVPVMAAFLVAVEVLPVFPASQPLNWAASVVALGVILALDIAVVFPWGVEKFDLVAPWQFREVNA